MAGKIEREARLAAQLRANLARRKQGARDAADAAADQRAKANEPSEVAAPAA